MVVVEVEGWRGVSSLPSTNLRNSHEGHMAWESKVANRDHRISTIKNELRLGDTVVIYRVPQFHFLYLISSYPNKSHTPTERPISLRL